MAVVDFKLFIVCTLSFFSVFFLSVLVVHYVLDCSCMYLGVWSIAIQLIEYYHYLYTGANTTTEVYVHVFGIYPLILKETHSSPIDRSRCMLLQLSLPKNSILQKIYGKTGSGEGATLYTNLVVEMIVVLLHNIHDS